MNKMIVLCHHHQAGDHATVGQLLSRHSDHSSIRPQLEPHTLYITCFIKLSPCGLGDLPMLKRSLWGYIRARKHCVRSARVALLQEKMAAKGQGKGGKS